MPQESKAFGKLVRFALSYPPIACFVMLTHNSHSTGALPFPGRVAMFPQTFFPAGARHIPMSGFEILPQTR